MPIHGVSGSSNVPSFSSPDKNQVVGDLSVFIRDFKEKLWRLIGEAQHNKDKGSFDRVRQFLNSMREQYQNQLGPEVANFLKTMPDSQAKKQIEADLKTVQASLDKICNVMAPDVPSDDAVSNLMQPGNAFDLFFNGLQDASLAILLS